MNESTRHFVVVREHGSAWDPALPLREQEGWQEHADFMNALVDDGFVVLGGPIGSGDRALLIVRAESEDEIRTSLAEDPWTPRMLTTASVEHWEILLGPDAPRG